MKRSDLSNLRICFVAGTLGQGGAERQLFYMIQALHRERAEVSLLSLTRGEYWEEPIKALGVPVRWVGCDRRRFLRAFRVINAVRRTGAQFVQSSHFFTNLYACAAARTLRRREVGSLRSNGMTDLLTFRNRTLGRASLRFPRLIATNSHTAIAAAVSQNVKREKLCYVPNAVDTEKFKPSPQPHVGPLRLLSVGRLRAEKRYDRYLSILDGLRRTGAAFKAVIAGDGPEREALEQRRRELGLDGHVEFLGPVKEVAALYQAADLLVLTSDWEGTPNSVLEAMASGLPVVACNVGDVAALAQNGRSGVVREPSDVDGFVAALAQLAAQPSLRFEMGRNAREYILERHSIEALPEALAGLYAQALS